MKKLLVISSLFVVIFAQTVFAADSTPSGDIADKLKEFQKEAASKAAQLKDLIARKLQNKAYTGTIATISGSSLTISAKSGPKMISINQDTVLPKKPLSSGNYVSALGDVDETGVLTAKKIILLNPNPYTLNPKAYLWGQIISISDLVTLRNKNFKNIAASLPQSKFKLNDIVILTGNFSENNIFQAEFVYVMPQTVIKPKKIATPSARVKD